MIKFNDFYLEMARPAKSFADSTVNSAYADALTFFRSMDEINPGTYTIWDYMFWNIPELAEDQELVNLKKKNHGTKLRDFVRDALKYKNVPSQDIISVLSDREAMEMYASRSMAVRGHRFKGKVNSILNK